MGISQQLCPGYAPLLSAERVSQAILKARNHQTLSEYDITQLRAVARVDGADPICSLPSLPAKSFQADSAAVPSTLMNGRLFAPSLMGSVIVPYFWCYAAATGISIKVTSIPEKPDTCRQAT